MESSVETKNILKVGPKGILFRSHCTILYFTLSDNCITLDRIQIPIGRSLAIKYCESFVYIYIYIYNFFFN